MAGRSVVLLGDALRKYIWKNEPGHVTMSENGVSETSGTRPKEVSY